MNTMLGASGRRSIAPSSSRSQRDRLDAVRLKRAFEPACRKTRDTDDATPDPCEVGRPTGHACERRPHLAGDTKHDQVTLNLPHRVDDVRGRIAEKRFKLRDIGDRTG